VPPPSPHWCAPRAWPQEPPALQSWTSA
jgi:hypothetical protein